MRKRIISLMLAVVLVLTGFVFPIAQPVFAKDSASAAYAELEEALSQPRPSRDLEAPNAADTFSQYNSDSWMNAPQTASSLSGVGVSSSAAPMVPAAPQVKLPGGAAESLNAGDAAAAVNDALRELNASRSDLISAAKAQFSDADGKAAAPSQPFPADRPVSQESAREIKPISAEEYEKLLAAQAPSSEEYLESLVLNREDDGERHRVEYSLTPVRYKTEDGSWAPIDPAVTVTQTKDGSRQIRSDKSSVRVDFRESTAKGGLVSLEQDGWTIAFAPVSEDGARDTASYSVRFDWKAGDACDTAAEARADRAYSNVIYSNAFPGGTELVYTPTGTGVKEEIVLQSVPSQKEFRFHLSTGGLTPVLREDGRVYLMDPKTSQFKAMLTAPYMYDSSADSEEPACSYDVQVSLYAQDDGSWLYCLTPDETWLKDSARVYPVHIDPTATFNTAGDIGDTYVYEAYNNTCFHTSNELQYGADSSHRARRDYFDFSAILAMLTQNNVTVSEASLVLYQIWNNSSAPDTRLYQLTSYIPISEITWNNQPDMVDKDNEFSYLVVRKPGFYTWDITTQVQAWIDNPDLLRMCVLRLKDENVNVYKKFCSTECATADQRPKFVVEYTTVPNAPVSAEISCSVNDEDSTKLDIAASWSAVSDADSYVAALYESVSGSWVKTSELETAETGCVFAMQNDSAQFFVRVWASNSDGVSAGYAESNQITTPDRTAPGAISSVTLSPATWTNGAVTVTHTAAADKSAVRYQYAVNASATSKPADSAYADLPSNTALTHSITPVAGTGYVWVRAVDASGNKGQPTCSSAPYKFCNTAPTVSAFVIAAASTAGSYNITAGFSSGTEGTVNWKLSYHVGTGSATGETTIKSGTSTSGSVSHAWNAAGLSDNLVYTVTLTLTDLAGNTASRSLTFLKADGSRRVSAALKLDGLAPKDSGSAWNVWKASWSKADAADAASYSDARLIVDSEPMDGLEYTVPLTTPEGQVKYVYVMAQDHNGEPAYTCDTYEKQRIFLSADVQTGLSLDSGLSLSNGKVSGSGTLTTSVEELPGTASFVDLYVNQTKPSGSAISYQISFDGGSTWTAITPVSTDGGVTVNNSNRLYVFGADTGSQVKIKAVLSKGSASSAPSISAISASVRYLFYGSGEIVNARFEPDGRGFMQLENTNVTDNGLALNSGASQGSVCSTPRSLSGNALSSRLIVDATVPSGAKIQYYLSTNGGASWQAIQTVPAGDQSTYNSIAAPGANLVLKAVLTPSSSGASPVLRSWNLEVKTAQPGEARELVLIDPPDNLSTLTDANNMTLLRWSPSETEGVVYKVYRSETPYFVPAEDNLAAQGLTDCYWYDYNLNFGHRYYYFVAADKDGRLSQSSNQAFGTAVDSNEFNKHLGLQSYWSFAQFDTLSGAGCVKVSNGNLVYQTTDLVISDPFFAMVMRRTYNSQAASKTALGAGWDFSFNTTLMRVCGSESGEFARDDDFGEVAMVLKDGDGSLHRFTRNADGSYQSAPGTRMTLVHDEANGEFVITRKDNVIYHFDDQSLRLRSFTNLAGAVLSFEYDLRGNMICATNSVGDRVELSYRILRGDAETASVSDPDYCWINEHIDMLSSVQWTSKNGAATIRYDYTYDAKDRLIKANTTIEGNYAYTETFTYDASGRLTAITNPNSRTYSLSYDLQGRCAKVTYPGALEATLFEYGKTSTTLKSQVKTDEPFTVTTYEYNASTGAVTKTTDARGHSINYTFTEDLLPESVSYTNYVNGELSDKPITQTFTYDASTRDLTICTVTWNGQKLAETRYESYIYNQPRRVKVLNNGSVLTTTYTYNTAGQVLTVKDPTGKTTKNTYNAKGWLSYVQDRNGAYTFYDYDVMGRVVTVSSSNSTKAKAFCVVRYTYDAYGRTATTSTNGMNDKTVYVWSKDMRGLLRSVTYPSGAKESYAYQRCGLLSKAVDADGVVTQYAYDVMGRLTKQTVTAGDYTGDSTWSYGGKTAYGVRRVVAYDAEKHLTSVWYDESGLAVRQQSGGVVTESRYDLMGRPTVSLVAGSADYKYSRMTRVEYDALGNQTLSAAVAKENMSCVGANGEKLTGYDASKDLTATKTFDQLGNVVTATDGTGVTTTYEYDALSRLTRVTQPLSVGQNAVTAYQYDVAVSGNIKNVTTAANGVKTESVFDKSGRLVSQTAAGSATTAYEYDAKGRTTKVTRPDNSYVAFTYDRMGNLLTEQYFAADASSPSVTSTYTYNDKGTRLLSVAQTCGEDTSTLSYTYDALGRVTQQRQETGAEAGSLQINYRYNKVGQVTAVSYPVSSGTNGETELSILRYVYNANGQLNQVWLDSGNADSDELSANAKLVRGYFYYINGQIYRTIDHDTFLDGDALTTEHRYTYDAFGLPTRLYYADTENGTTTVKEDTKYTYDKNGNILTETATQKYQGTKTVKKTYTYDLSGRMTKAVIDGKATTYSYDAVGNRLTRTADGKTSNYSYDDLNRLTKIVTGAETVSYTYDARGNQLTETTASAATYTVTKTFTYDLADRLTGYTCDAKQGSTDVRLNTSSYGYNALGQRVTRVENDVITHFYYTGSALLYTTENEYLLKTQNILSPSGEIVASKRFEGATHEQTYAGKYFFYRYDIRGSVTNIVDGTGASVKSYDYDEFGNTTASDSGFHNDVTFTGSVADASGLQYMNARYYNPETARYITQDSYTGTASEPWTQHLYAYCNNNPVNMVDPTGHTAIRTWNIEMTDGPSDPYEDENREYWDFVIDKLYGYDKGKGEPVSKTEHQKKAFDYKAGVWTNYCGIPMGAEVIAQLEIEEGYYQYDLWENVKQKSGKILWDKGKGKVEEGLVAAGGGALVEATNFVVDYVDFDSAGINGISLSLGDRYDAQRVTVRYRYRDAYYGNWIYGKRTFTHVFVPEIVTSKDCSYEVMMICQIECTTEESNYPIR